jgi:hypothetical protein
MKLELTGKTFGRYKVVSKVTRPGDKHSFWNVQCSCGTNNIVRGDILTCGQATSCGCYHKEIQAKRFTTHGGSFTSEYSIWENMVARCTNPTNKFYKNYGGRGITVSPKWFSYGNFVADLGKRPAGYTLERLDNDKGYSKENCVWATRHAQARNKRNNHNITYNDVTMCLTDWARSLGISPSALDRRLKKWTLDEALTRTITEATYVTDPAYKLRTLA